MYQYKNIYLQIHIYFFMYHQQQNKWYPQRCLLIHIEAKIECSFEMGK